jgi:hypothetical protein
MKYKMAWEVFDAVRKARTKDAKVAVLKENDCAAIRDYSRCFYDDRIEFALPKGEAPPYEANDPHTAPTNFMRKNTQLKYFVKGIKECEQLKPFKREAMFIQLLEGIHPRDAELLIDMINKNLPRRVGKEVVAEAFPGLLPE